jgi:glycosyltransferase involved in cell wall biosynthesis
MNFDGKLVFLVPGFPKDEADQNCLPYLQDLILLLKDRLEDGQIEIISFHYPFIRSSYLWNNIQVHAIGGKNRKGIFKLLTWIRILWLLKTLHSKRSIDILHAVWLNETALMAQIFGYLTKTKSMVTIIGQDPLKSNNYLKLLRLKPLRLIGISKFVSEQLDKSTGYKADDVIPLVWRKHVFENLPESSLSFDILGVGNISPLKNFSLFIEVVEELVNERPHLKCAIIGSGKQLPELQKTLEDKRLSNNLQFLGETDRDVVLSIMKQSKVLLHTSKYESQGFAMSEALFQGMKVVSTPVSDTESNTFIEVGRTAKELAICVRNALESPIRESIIYYPPEKAIDQYLNHYLTLVK